MFEFADQYGTITSTKIQKDIAGTKAYIQFQNVEDAERFVQEKDGTMFRERAIEAFIANKQSKTAVIKGEIPQGLQEQYSALVQDRLRENHATLNSFKFEKLNDNNKFVAFAQLGSKQEVQDLINNLNNQKLIGKLAKETRFNLFLFYLIF